MMRFFSFLVCLIIVSCSSSPYSDQYTTIEPLARDVVGSYEYDFQNADKDAHDSIDLSRKPFIVVNPDKTYTFHRMPSLKKNGDEFRFDKNVTVSGKWKLIPFQTLSGNEKHWGLEFESAPDDLQRVGFLGTRAPRGLILFYGNPSDGKFMVLRKK